MRNQRNFSLEFKRQVVEELLSDQSWPAHLCRWDNMNSSVLYHWRKQYSRGKFNNEPTADGALQDRIEKLERLVDRLILENELLKKGLSIPSSSRREATNHHSDKGVQYASGEYVDRLCSHGFLISMACAGNSYDNAMIESFSKTLKHEEVNLCDLRDFRGCGNQASPFH